MGGAFVDQVQATQAESALAENQREANRFAQAAQNNIDAEAFVQRGIANSDEIQSRRLYEITSANAQAKFRAIERSYAQQLEAERQAERQIAGEIGGMDLPSDYQFPNTEVSPEAAAGIAPRSRRPLSAGRSEVRPSLFSIENATVPGVPRTPQEVAALLASQPLETTSERLSRIAANRTDGPSIVASDPAPARAKAVRDAALLNFLGGQNQMALGGVISAGASIMSGGDSQIASAVTDLVAPLDNLIAPMGGGPARTTLGSGSRRLTALDWSRSSPRTGGDAAEHVFENHGSLSLTKPNQGVFYGNPIAAVEDAWSIVQQYKLPATTVGNRDIYVVPRPNSGYAGGMGGQLQNFDHVTIITETGTARVVTGYPSGGTPPLPLGYKSMLGNP